jgi:hypothetical protein
LLEEHNLGRKQLLDIVLASALKAKGDVAALVDPTVCHFRIAPQQKTASRDFSFNMDTNVPFIRRHIERTACKWSRILGDVYTKG